MESNSFNKQYIAYNIKCFFDYYCLNERIIKLNADIILLSQLRKDVEKNANFAKQNSQTLTKRKNVNKRFQLLSLISDRENKCELSKRSKTSEKDFFSTMKVKNNKTRMNTISPKLSKINNQIVQKYLEIANIKKMKYANNTYSNRSKEKKRSYTKSNKKRDHYAIVNYANKKFSNKIYECIYIMLKRNLLPFPQSICLIFTLKQIYINYPQSEMIHEYINHLTSKYEKCKLYMNRYNEREVSEKFIPSKTALNGLNFITKEEESKLIATEESQPQQIQNLFILILILLNENYDLIPQNKIISFIFQVIFIKYNVDSIKRLFCECIIPHLHMLNTSQIEKMVDLYKQNTNLLSLNDIVKTKQNISYMTFIIREIYAYSFKKSEDGTSFYILRQVRNEMRMIKTTIEKMRIKLKK